MIERSADEVFDFVADEGTSLVAARVTHVENPRRTRSVEAPGSERLREPEDQRHEDETMK